MANRTVKDAKTIKGTNPQYLIEKIIRSRIYDSKYWKEECFALTAELIVDKAMELKYVGGVFAGNIKPSPFLCLALKMLQIQPEKDIVVEFIKQEDFKYVRALGAFYMRLTGTSLDCFKYLEPLLNDYRKMRFQKRDGHFELMHMDEFIDSLLRDERTFDVILPRISKRWVHEANNELEPRVSALEDDLDVEEEEDEMDVDELEPVPERNENALKERERHKEKDKRRDSEKDSKTKRRDKEREKIRDRISGRRRRSRERDEKHHERERDRDKERIRGRERDRHHRDRDVEKERDRERRQRKRPREEERTKRSRRSRSPTPLSKHRKDDRKKSSKNSVSNEIAEANALRAKLGLKPLK